MFLNLIDISFLLWVDYSRKSPAGKDDDFHFGIDSCIAGAERVHLVSIDIFFPVGKCYLGGEYERGEVAHRASWAK